MSADEQISPLLLDKEEKLFAKKLLGSITVDSNITVADFKIKVYNELVKPVSSDLKDEINCIDSIRLRNPKNDDLGEVMLYNDEDLLEKYFLFDGKEFLVQKAFTKVQEASVYNLLVREWNPQTWEFGTLYEITVDKLLSYDKLAVFL